MIRTADVDLEGRLKVTAGATLVRDSEAAYEVAETHAKAGGILAAFGLVEPASPAAEGLDELTRDEDVVIALGSRNQRLSRFWLTDQGGSPPAPELKGKTAVILDGEDHRGLALELGRRRRPALVGQPEPAQPLVARPERDHDVLVAHQLVEPLGRGGRLLAPARTPRGSRPPWRGSRRPRGRPRSPAPTWRRR